MAEKDIQHPAFMQTHTHVHTPHTYNPTHYTHRLWQTERLFALVCVCARMRAKKTEPRDSKTLPLNISPQVLHYSDIYFSPQSNHYTFKTK